MVASEAGRRWAAVCIANSIKWWCCPQRSLPPPPTVVCPIRTWWYYAPHHPNTRVSTYIHGLCKTKVDLALGAGAERRRREGQHRRCCACLAPELLAHGQCLRFV